LSGESGSVSAEDDFSAGVPYTPAGRQMAWLLRVIADEGASARLSDRERYAPSLYDALTSLQDDAAWQEDFRRYASRLGAPVEVSIERSSDQEIAVLLATAKGSKWTITLTVEPDPPHRILAIRTDRKYDFKLDVREATEADALILADIERRCPIVMGDTSVWFERGDSYFDFSRLMEDCTIGLASVDGVPAAVSCGAEHQVRVDGAMKTMLTVSHLRVLPEHQRKGLWGAANSALDKYWSHVDGSAAYISVDNLAMQHGFVNSPDKWPQVVERVELDCATLAGPMIGRSATPTDAGEIVRRLNAFHDTEEMFVPYTEASFSARMSRAPDLYAWDKIWMTEGALVGVWPAGNALRSITETNGASTATVPAVVLDYAFNPGFEKDLEALLRAWCASLAPRGMDTLVIYTSPAAAGAELLLGLARATGEFFVWTPGIAVPPGAETRGLYVDAIYF
jgi:hypothetical protein